MCFYISSNITLKKVMLPEKLICKSAFLVHLIKKKNTILANVNCTTGNRGVICDLDCSLIFQFLSNECNTDLPVNVNRF